MVSLGGYSLKNFNSVTVDGGMLYKAELYKHNKRVALVEDNGEKGMNVILASKGNSVRKGEFDYILADMKSFLKILEPITTSDAFVKDFARDNFMAVVGFSTLLVDLMVLEEHYTKGIKEVEPNKYFAVGTLGSTWFSKQDSDLDTTPFFFDTKAATYKTAHKRTMEKADKLKPKCGNLTSLVLANGEINWDLSFEDYLDLNTIHN